MLYYLFHYLEECNFPGARLFGYISFRSAMAVILSLLITMIFGKKLIEYLRRRQIGESVRTLYLEGQNQKAGTPTMGGIIIIASILVPVLLLCDVTNIYVMLLIFTTVWLGAIGFADDYIKVFKHNKDGLSSRAKLLGQITLGVVIGVAIMATNTTVFSSRSQIKGITTSVALWVCAIIGLTLGAGLYVISLISFISLILSLTLFPTFEQYMKNRSNYFEVHLELKNASFLQDFIQTGRKLGLRIDDIESNPAYLNSGLSVYTISISIISKELKKYKTHSEIIEALNSLEYVSHIEEMN